MVNWTMKVAGQLGPLIGRIEDVIREGAVIGMHENPVKVLDHPKTGKDRQGYMCPARGGPQDKPLVQYWFAPRRGIENFRAFLGSWQGWLQTDGYCAYETALAGTPIIHVGCWAHARRKFVEAAKISPSNLAKDAIGRIKKLYELEKGYRDHAKRFGLDDQALLNHRKELLEDHLATFRQWLDHEAARPLPGGALGKAMTYTLGQRPKLVTFLDHASLTPDNNRVENAIRPLAVGRKN
jgi:transposase